MQPTVLLIEDNEQNRYLATFLLEQRGYRVVAAMDGASGIEAATRVAPDIILLDIQLPAMDGYAVARALRRTGIRFSHGVLLPEDRTASPGTRRRAHATLARGRSRVADSVTPAPHASAAAPPAAWRGRPPWR